MTSHSETLPLTLQQALAPLLEVPPLEILKQSYRILSERYRTLSESAHSSKPLLMTEEIQRLAYLASRLPATYAVVHHVLQQLPLNFSLKSLLDLGAGPGTVLWAAREVLPDLSQATLIEQDAELSRLAAQLLKSILNQFSVKWQLQDLIEIDSFLPHDLVTLSYVLGELGDQDQRDVLFRAWQAANYYMVLIEPGTPTGFASLRRARHFLLDQGAFLIAPCSHHEVCPMGGQDWCHFSQRVNRSSLHRRIKEGSLPFEDEKYSYLIVSKFPGKPLASRIIRRPKKGKGHFLVDLCTADGLKRLIISRKQKELYKVARSLEWGDAGPPFKP